MCIYIYDTSIHCPAHSKGAPFSLGWLTAQSSRYWWELRKLLTLEGSESEHDLGGTEEGGGP